MDTNLTTLLIILGVTALVSVLGLFGGILLLWNENLARRGSRYLISFAAGSLLGATFLDLLPEALDLTNQAVFAVGWGILSGILVFFILEKLLVWHHHAHRHALEHETAEPEAASLVSARPLIILGDALHNLLDGAVIAIAFLTAPSLGVITALAVVAHELPQEIGDFSILLHSGLARRAVFLWNLVGGLVSLLGVGLVFIADRQFHSFQGPLLGFIIGNFIYIALADLVPTVHRERDLKRSLAQIALLVVGILLIWGVGTLLPE